VADPIIEQQDGASVCGERAWVEIDTEAWKQNYRNIQQAVAPAVVLAVVKANAYGLGVRQAAKAFYEAGARHFAVAGAWEGRQLVDLDLPDLEVLLLGAPLPEEIPEIVQTGMVASVTSLDVAERLSREAVRRGRTVKVHIQVDTGMGRLGISAARASDEIPRILDLPGLIADGIYTHLPAAGLRDELTYGQIREFARLIRNLDMRGIRFRWRHIGSSAAVAGLPDTHASPFNMVRPGLDLHGAHLSCTPRPYPTVPVFGFKSRLVAVRRLPCGSTVSYGRTYRVANPDGELIGTVSAGYADGYPRALSNVGQVLVRGRRCPVIGRVCMDYTMISLQDVPEAQYGDEVVLIGRQGDEEVGIAEVARAARTIPYELMCQLGPRVRRVYR